MPYFVLCSWKVPTSLLSFEKKLDKIIPWERFIWSNPKKREICLTLFIIKGELIHFRLYLLLKGS